MGDHQGLREAGLKVTVPRVKIIEILEKAKPRHMSAEDVYKELVNTGEDVGLATVYRVLTQFEAAGLVTRHNFDADHAVFELDEGEHHDHIVCVKCGYVDEFLDEVVEKRLHEITKQSGFLITDHSLTLYGVCETCET